MRSSDWSSDVCSSDLSFERYPREEAWTWEHMALLRARAGYGSDAARAAVDRIVAEVLASPRAGAAVATGDSKGVVSGKGVEVRVELGWLASIKITTKV